MKDETPLAIDAIAADEVMLEGLRTEAGALSNPRVEMHEHDADAVRKDAADQYIKRMLRAWRNSTVDAPARRPPNGLW